MIAVQLGLIAVLDKLLIANRGQLVFTVLRIGDNVELQLLGDRRTAAAPLLRRGIEARGKLSGIQLEVKAHHRLVAKPRRAKPGSLQIQIGLAPGGKVAVWLRGIGSQPNYRVTPSVLMTVSGDKLELCKGITRHPNGYKYYGDTPEFIKGKTYPYGNW
ncbi:DUF2931 family protein [Serratia fonticola]|nr:DUF2931 family protein [Serratia fonticola]